MSRISALLERRLNKSRPAPLLTSKSCVFPKEEEPSIDKFYRVSEKILGQGSNGVVFLGHRLEDEKPVAIKEIRTDDEELIAHLKKEVILNISLAHPNLVKLLGVYFAVGRVHLVSSYSSGGDLREKVLADGPFEESTASTLAREIFAAVKYMHFRGVLHRDVKPENIYLCDGHVQVGDFGVAISFTPEADEVLGQTGTPLFWAPEVVKGVYSPKSDVWAAGVVSFFLLSGHLPFQTEKSREVYSALRATEEVGLEGEAELFEAICEGNFTMPKTWSRDCQHFIRSVLSVDGNARPTAAECLVHPWLAR